MCIRDRPQIAPAQPAAAGAGPATSNDWLLTGDAMDSLDDARLQQRMTSVCVCARIAPTQKLRIVQALKANGEVVAMTCLLYTSRCV